MAVHDVFVAQYFGFFEVANPHRAWGFASDFLAFQQADAGRAVHGYSRQALGFVETARLTGDQSRSVTQTLAFADEAFRAAAGYAYQNLVMVQSPYLGIPSGGGQALLFSQTAALANVRPAIQTWAFHQTATLGAVRDRRVSQTLAFDEGASVYAPEARRYATPDPGLAPAATVHLSTPAGSMTLPAPDWENSENLGQTRVARNARGGTFIVFRPDYWPTTDEFDLTFSYLSETQVARLRALVSRSVGLLCTFTDHEGRSRQVLVTNPDLVVTQVGRQNYTVPLKLLAAH